MILSVVVPCRNEFPNVVHTCYSILHSWEASGFDPKDIEIILVNNASDDSYYPQRGTRGTTDYLMTRGGFWARVIRMIYDPIAGNHSARNKGAEIARGEYLFFSDAHMAYSPMFFKYMLETVKETGGIVHAPIGWMGAYPPASTNMGYQYTIKLGEEIKGCVDEDTEILTRDGWKKWNEVSYDTEFATVKMSGKDAKTIEFQKPRDLVIKDYSGEMVRIEHRNYDALLTLNHRCFYQSKELKSHITEGSRSEYEWRVKTAENLDGKEYLPVSTKGLVSTSGILKDEFVELVGWIITEGSYSEDGSIVIVQYKIPNRDRIKKCLDSLGISYSIKGRRGDFKIHQNDGRFIRTVLVDKKLTQEFLLRCNRKQLDLLYETMISGDGHRSKTNDKFYQKDKSTIDAFQTLCILTGKQSKVFFKSKESYKGNHFGGDMYFVSVKKNPTASSFKVSRTNYKGKVWCPDLVNGNIFIRRNGQTAITGNTWNNYCLDDKKWFYIPALGHCSLIVRKDQFLDFGGYPKVHRCYGGGEFYVNMKWWMFGSNVAVEPRAFAYHLASGRGYTYDHDDYTENVIGIAYALGMDDWRYRTYLNCLRKNNRKVMDSIMERSAKEHQSDREFIEGRKKLSFNELILIKTKHDGRMFSGLWNKMNMEKFGKCNGQLTIFHPTWIQLLKSVPDSLKELYRNSEEEKSLNKFIVENMWDFVYHNNEYDRDKLPTI